MQSNFPYFTSVNAPAILKWWFCEPHKIIKKCPRPISPLNKCTCIYMTVNMVNFALWHIFISPKHYPPSNSDYCNVKNPSLKKL